MPTLQDVLDLIDLHTLRYDDGEVVVPDVDALRAALFALFRPET